MQIAAKHRVALFERTAIVLDVMHGRYLLYDAELAQGLGQLFFEVENSAPPLVLDALVEDGVLVDDDGQGTGGRIFDYRTMRFHQFSSEPWSSRRLSGWSSSRTEMRFLIRLMWRAASLQMRGFTALQKLEKYEMGSALSLSQDKLRALEIPERFLKASL